jgi:hypothetical protein
MIAPSSAVNAAFVFYRNGGYPCKGLRGGGGELPRAWAVPPSGTDVVGGAGHHLDDTKGACHVDAVKDRNAREDWDSLLMRTDSPRSS